MWCPLVSIALAIRDGLVRVSGIDPKGMELAYGRRIFTRYAVTGTDALAVLDELIGALWQAKADGTIPAHVPLVLLVDEVNR